MTVRGLLLRAFRQIASEKLPREQLPGTLDISEPPSFPALPATP
jgi:hypothetical protein